jgi:O-antigen/teichoic acid export membrane protein
MAFLINPILSFLEGLGKVRDVAQMRLIQQVTMTLTLWISLFSKAKLYSSGISGLLGLLIICIVIYISPFRKILTNIWKTSGTERINYKTEIFPYQWKIALSWISGYFIFQLFNPVLFATEGAVIAGQMGMTLAVLNGIMGLSFSWMSTKVPLYSGLIAQNKYSELDLIFNRTLIQSVIINGFGLTVLFFCIYVLRIYNIALGNRFLPYLPLILMMAPVFMNQFVSSWATYLRCHKQEPFLIPSIVGGVAMSLSTIILGKYYGVIGMTLGYCILTFFGGVVWGYFIFKTKRIIWH